MRLVKDIVESSPEPSTMGGEGGATPRESGHAARQGRPRGCVCRAAFLNEMSTWSSGRQTVEN